MRRFRAAVFVAGDATAMMQSALGAAAEGVMTAAMLNHALAGEDRVVDEAALTSRK
jgi:thioredoxin reductase